MFSQLLRELDENRIIRLTFKDYAEVAYACCNFGLDFDDDYQYVAAKIHNLKLFSLDGDFDRTDRKRKTPKEALELLSK